MLNSLNNKVIFSLLLVILLGAFLTAFIVILTVQYQMSQKYAVEKQASIESLSVAIADSLKAEKYDQVEKTIRSALVYDNIVSVSVFDRNGSLIDFLTDTEDVSGETELSRHTLAFEGEQVGSIEIGFSDRYIGDLVQKTVIALIFVVVGFLLLVGLSFYLFLRRSILQPIRNFTRTVDKINTDNLALRVNIRSGDEIGYLAKAFNNMTENLEKSQTELKKSRDELEVKVEQRTASERRRTEQLRTINEVGRRISSFLSLDELLPYVVDSLLETFQYYNVNIFLMRPGDSDMELSAGAGGYKDEVPVGFIVGSGQGIVGTAAGEGEPLMINDVSKDSRYISSEDLPKTRAELAVPIRLGEDMLGVLDIQSDEINSFDEIDVFTAQTIGDQLAVAIQNARLYKETREIAVIAERNRLAREIHDTLAQGFAGIVVQLEAAEQAINEDKNGSLEHLEAARKLARESLNEARRSVWALRPQALETLTLVEALRAEVENSRNTGDIDIRLNTPGEWKTLNPDVENALLRIFQEALNNVRKHSGAKNVGVDLGMEDEKVVLRISDDGAGFDTGMDMMNRFGLIGMRERAKLLGGTFEIYSEPGHGTRLEAKLPV